MSEKISAEEAKAINAPSPSASDVKRSLPFATSQVITVPQASESSKSDKKPFWTWDRSIDVLKIAATIWVAAIGSIVTMQFNERQHELNRIEAIAQMLPHMSEQSKSDSKEVSRDHMGRDGAIWAIFRTANNRKMLRDLAALFPEDIYRVVSSIALGGELERDPDAIVALEVSSEKLASQYSTDPKRAEMASKLYAQALALKQRTADDTTPLRVLDLTATISDTEPSDDQLASLIKSINNLADLHLSDVESTNAKQKSGGSHWESKQLYLRAERLGRDNKDKQVLQQVMRADVALAKLYVHDQVAQDAFHYLKKAFECESNITGKSSVQNFKALDQDNNGFAALPELTAAINSAEVRLSKINEEFKDKGAEVQSSIQNSLKKPDADETNGE